MMGVLSNPVRPLLLLDQRGQEDGTYCDRCANNCHSDVSLYGAS